MDKSEFSIFVLRNYFLNIFAYHMPNEVLCEIISKDINGILVASGHHHVCLVKNRQLYTCGDNSFGQLGLGDNDIRKQFCKVPILNVTKVACGFTHTVILTRDGHVYTTGQNMRGQLGLGDNNGRNKFHKVNILGTVCEIACGNHFTVAVTKDGKIYSCGENNQGQLGLGSYNHYNKPRKVKFTDAKNVFCGSAHMFILTRDNYLFGTGRNNNAQLGLNHEESVNTLERIPLINIAIVSCASEYSVALTTCNAVLVTGSLSILSVQKGKGTLFELQTKKLGEIGNPQFKEFHTCNLENITDVVSYGNQTFLITKEGKLFNYQAPKGSHLQQSISQINKIVEENNTRIRTITCGFAHILAITDNGKIYVDGMLGKLYSEFTEIKL